MDGIRAGAPRVHALAGAGIVIAPGKRVERGYATTIERAKVQRMRGGGVSQ